MNTNEIWPGQAFPPGATYDGSGTNFMPFSEVAERVELCLIYEDGKETRVDVYEVDASVWHCYLPRRAGRGSAGSRVEGQFVQVVAEPSEGFHRPCTIAVGSTSCGGTATTS